MYGLFTYRLWTNVCNLLLLTTRLEELIFWWPWCHTITLLKWGIYRIPTQIMFLWQVKMMRAMLESKHSNLITSCAHWAQRLQRLDKRRLSADCSWISDQKCGLVNLFLLLAPRGFLIYTFENLRSIYRFVLTIMKISKRHQTYIIDQLCFYSTFYL
jgi:hypothetical protein